MNPGEPEATAGTPAPRGFTDATRELRVEGAIVLRQVFPRALVEEMRDAFLDRCRRYMHDVDHADALKVGDRRFMVTPVFEPPFSDPAFYAAGPVLARVRELLGDNCVLGSFGSFLSLAGAKDQRVHRDFPGLFPDVGLDPILPPYAITMVVPLIDVDDVTGTTLYWPRSHRQRGGASRCEGTAPVRPHMAMGDCLLMDYRLVHAGSANHSAGPRPVLYNAYCRPWFRDHENYSRQGRLVVSREVLDQVPVEYRSMFDP